MNFKQSYVLKALLVLSGVVFFVSCEKEFTTLGVELVEDTQFDLKKKYFNVLTYNRNLDAVRSDGLTAVELSDYTDEVFGGSRASFAAQLALSNSGGTFGKLSPEQELAQDTDGDMDTLPENEMVTRVYLDLPFFSQVFDTLENDNEPRPYRVDSIFGDRAMPFSLKVQEFTKYLRPLDPSSGFTQQQEYFSNEDPLPFATTVLFEGQQELDLSELIFFDNEDDPDTEEDESLEVSSRFSPRIRVDLDTDFFQERIIDMEGEEVLTNNQLFQEYLRGLYISMTDDDNNLKMLLNTAEGNLVVRYEYDTYNEETSAVEKAADSVSFGLNGGRIVNYFQEDVYPQEILDAVTAEANADRLYLKGQSGVVAQVDLLGGNGSVEEVFAEAIANDWLINEANLVFYIDEVKSGSQPYPQRMYLYDLDNGITVIDYNRDPAGDTQNPATAFAFYGGILSDEDGEVPHYKFRITEHIKRIINDDSTNVNLGLIPTANISNPRNVKAQNAVLEDITIAQAGITYPYSVVLFGANAAGEDVDYKVQLEVIYTERKK